MLPIAWKVPGAIRAACSDRGGGVSSAPFEVADFCLYESQLTRDGAVYAVVERYPLIGG